MDKCKPISGFPDYLIYEDGRVFSIRSKKFLSTCLCKSNGYLMIGLHVNGKRHNKTVHRLMGLTFLTEEGQSNLHINHKDGDKTNNQLSNLELVTQSENLKHAFAMGLSERTREAARVRMASIGRKYSKANGDRLKRFAKETSKPVLQLDLNNNIVAEYASIKEATRVTGFGNINKVIKGKYKQSGGFQWVVKSEYCALS